MEKLPEKKDAEFQIQVRREDLNIENLIVLAIQNNTPVENLERLLAVRKELRAEFAERRFYEDLKEFQSRCPVMEKKKEARAESGLMYKYAPMDQIVEQVRDLLKELGFSYTFTSNVREDGRIEAVCTAHHVDGHHLSSAFAPRLIRQTRAMSDTQQDSGSYTTAMRRAFCSLFAIASGDEDLDGQQLKAQQSREETITETSLQRIQVLEAEARVTEESLLKFYKVSVLTELTERQAQNAIRELERRKDQKNAKES